MTEGIKTIVKTFYKVGNDEFSDYQEALEYLERQKERASRPVWMSEYLQHLREWSVTRRVRFVSVSDATPAYGFLNGNGELEQSHNICLYTDGGTDSDGRLLATLITLSRFAIQLTDLFFRGGRVSEILLDVLKYVRWIREMTDTLEELVYPPLDECNE